MQDEELTTIDESIAQAVTEPQQHSADGESTTSRSLTELLDARDRIAARNSARCRRRGMPGLIVSRFRTQGGGVA